MSKIEWTDETWNPSVGCSRVSKGCEHCYAEGVAHRGMSESHRGLTVLGKHGPRWTGEVRFLSERLERPLRWRKPRRVFVNSMSDLFHESLTFEQIAAVFGVMSACPQHTFQVLTKRPERAREFFAWLPEDCHHRPKMSQPGRCFAYLYSRVDIDPVEVGYRWPLSNVWLGVSVEDQATADERIPLLLQCPAAVRWVSYEPALGPVDFTQLRPPEAPTHHTDALAGFRDSRICNRLDWIVVGGESGARARPFNLAWARATIGQGHAAGVPVFVKQLGASPFVRMDDKTIGTVPLLNSKGGDPSEWPEDLRVRAWPEARA